jgi:zona occludens toxin (predicted ATPase)
MIHLITGTPGSGKTLLAVELILKNRRSENIRPLYANIEGLNLDELRCFKLEDVEQWYELPDNSIIVIDECQRWFRPRPNGSAVPECISRFETHRHHGHDIILISQHPGLIDRNIRKLVDRHQHMYRPFGLDHRKAFEWNTCNENPEPSQNEANALKTKMKFDEDLYRYYHSASIHTGTKRYPFKQIATFIGAILFTILLGGNFVYSKLAVANSGHKDTQLPKEQAQLASHPQEQAIMHVQALPLRQLLYRGHIKSSTELILILEDQETGQRFDLPDFDGYRKEGVEVVFYLAGAAQEYTYRVRDRELLALLP